MRKPHTLQKDNRKQFLKSITSEQEIKPTILTATVTWFGINQYHSIIEAVKNPFFLICDDINITNLYDEERNFTGRIFDIKGIPFESKSRIENLYLDSLPRNFIIFYGSTTLIFTGLIETNFNSSGNKITIICGQDNFEIERI